MRDVQIAELAGRQYNRVSRQQLRSLGLDDDAIDRRLANRRLVVVEPGVFAVAPLLGHDPWGKWMGATLTSPASVLSHESAAAAWGIWEMERACETVTRPGNGGPRRHGAVIVHRSSTLNGDCTQLRGIPITSVPRTLLDLSARLSRRALARTFREAVRLELTTPEQLRRRLRAWKGRRGSLRLARTVARYDGLPLRRARSGAEIQSLEILRNAKQPMPVLNMRVAGEEADLCWPKARLIVEIDGGPFHLDKGEDARKQEIWEAAGWTVGRLSSEDVYERPYRLLEVVRAHVLDRTAAPNVPDARG